MSEYQYYEFQAVDRPLTEKEMRELRSYSTRARITPTSFVNDYSWGSFKGNVDAWMEKYFDAFLYFANWRTHILKLRLPSRLLDLRTARLYCPGEGAFVREKNGKVIVTLMSEDEGGDEWVEGEGLLSSLISVRAEIARGDLRCLYLGWLLCAQNGELDEEEIEPPVPPGLAQLSASLESLIEFLSIDPNLIHVAAQASQPLELAEPKQEEIMDWVGKLPSAEKDEMLTRIITGQEVTLATEFFRRFNEERRPGERPSAEKSQRRMVGELRQAAEERAEEHRRLAAKKAAEEKARRDREAAMAREKYLQEIAGREPQLWNQLKELIATKQPQKYDQAVKLLVDLRDLAARKGKREEFEGRLDALRAAEARKPSFIQRLRRMGL